MHLALHSSGLENLHNASIKTGYVFVKPKDMLHTSDMLPNTRPIIRAVRQKHRSDNQDCNRRTFNLPANGGGELGPNKHQKGGITKNLCSSDIVLN